MNPEELITVECSCDNGFIKDDEICDLCEGDGYLELTEYEFRDWEISIFE